MLPLAVLFATVFLASLGKVTQILSRRLGHQWMSISIYVFIELLCNILYHYTFIYKLIFAYIICFIQCEAYCLFSAPFVPQIAIKVHPGVPEQLVPVETPGTPTVSNAHSLASRTLIRCLQLELRVRLLLRDLLREQQLLSCFVLFTMQIQNYSSKRYKNTTAYRYRIWYVRVTGYGANPNSNYNSNPKLTLNLIG